MRALAQPLVRWLSGLILHSHTCATVRRLIHLGNYISKGQQGLLRAVALQRSHSTVTKWRTIFMSTPQQDCVAVRPHRHSESRMMEDRVHSWSGW